MAHDTTKQELDKMFKEWIKENTLLPTTRALCEEAIAFGFDKALELIEAWAISEYISDEYDEDGKYTKVSSVIGVDSLLQKLKELASCTTTGEE